SGERPRKRDASSSIFSRRLDVSAIRREVSTTLASSMILFLPVRRRAGKNTPSARGALDLAGERRLVDIKEQSVPARFADQAACGRQIKTSVETKAAPGALETRNWPVRRTAR